MRTRESSDTSDRVPQIGDVYLVEFTGDGSEQRGIRPGVVFQNNLGNKYSPNVVVLPMTTAIKKVGQPTHILIPSEVGLKKDSLVLCENPETITKAKLGKFICKIPDYYMKQIAVGSILASSAIAFISKDELSDIWNRAVSINMAA